MEANTVQWVEANEANYREYATKLVREWLDTGLTHFVEGPDTCLALTEEESKRYINDVRLTIMPISGNEQEIIKRYIPWVKKNYPEKLPNF
ncbi:MAG: hypothetical protein AAB861_02290 [Patescibacteria group bacterium]